MGVLFLDIRVLFRLGFVDAPWRDEQGQTLRRLDDDFYLAVDMERSSWSSRVNIKFRVIEYTCDTFNVVRVFPD